MNEENKPAETPATTTKPAAAEPEETKEVPYAAPDPSPKGGPACHRWFKVPCYALGEEAELLQTLYVRRTPDGWIVRTLRGQGLVYVPDPEHVIYGYFETNPVH